MIYQFKLNVTISVAKAKHTKVSMEKKSMDVHFDLVLRVGKSKFMGKN